MLANPSNSIAHVDGSGTGGALTPSTITDKVVGMRL